MKGLAVLSGAGTPVGRCSPSPAGTPKGQVFRVTVYENDKERDTGLLEFLADPRAGSLQFQSRWFGQGAWNEGGDWKVVGDLGDEGCSWEARFRAPASAPYDELEGGYYAPGGDRSRAIIYGWVQPIDQDTDFWFYGEVLSGPHGRTPIAAAESIGPALSY